MNESIGEIHRLLQEAIALLKSGTKPDAREAANKLKRIAALASTVALTIEGRRQG
jgi:hypothetical protein